MSFTLFPELPTELRLKIWGHALPGPRIIRISSAPYYPSPGKALDITFERFIAGFPRNTMSRKLTVHADERTLKSLFRTCKESRDVVMQGYRLLFQNPIGKYICIDPSIDTLFFSDTDASDTFFKHKRGEEIKGADTIRHLGVLGPSCSKASTEDEFYTEQKRWLANTRRVVVNSGKVEKLTLVPIFRNLLVVGSGESDEIMVNSLRKFLKDDHEGAYSDDGIEKLSKNIEIADDSERGFYYLSHK